MSIFGLQNNNAANRPMFVCNKWKFHFEKLNLKTVTGTFKNICTITKEIQFRKFFSSFYVLSDDNYASRERPRAK